MQTEVGKRRGGEPEAQAVGSPTPTLPVRLYNDLPTIPMYDPQMAFIWGFFFAFYLRV
jgi:hypothetical protein